jgi:hypothetical protein
MRQVRNATKLCSVIVKGDGGVNGRIILKQILRK